MNKLQTLIGTVFIALSFNSVSAEEPTINTTVWLERGCIALAHFVDNGRWVEGESAVGHQVQLWLNGCMVGINAMCFSTDPSPDITFPPEGWNDGRIIAPLILEFMKNNPDIPPLTKASHVVTAWYLSAHPKATRVNKTLSKILIEQIIENPDDYN